MPRRSSNQDPTSRKCRICQETKPIEEFVKNKWKPAGRSYECLPCHNRITQERSLRIRYKRIGANDAAGEVVRAHQLYLIKYKVYSNLFARKDENAAGKGR